MAWLDVNDPKRAGGHQDVIRPRRGETRWFQIQEIARQKAVSITDVSLRKDMNQWKHEQSTSDWEAATQEMVCEHLLDVANSTFAVPTIGAQEP